MSSQRASAPFHTSRPRAKTEGDAAPGCDPALYTYRTSNQSPASAVDDTFNVVAGGTLICFARSGKSGLRPLYLGTDHVLFFTVNLSLVLQQNQSVFISLTVDSQRAMNVAWLDLNLNVGWQAGAIEASPVTFRVLESVPYL
jgi:hypothetical protein